MEGPTKGVLNHRYLLCNLIYVKVLRWAQQIIKALFCFIIPSLKLLLLPSFMFRNLQIVSGEQKTKSLNDLLSRFISYFPKTSDLKQFITKSDEP